MKYVDKDRLVRWIQSKIDALRGQQDSTQRETRLTALIEIKQDIEYNRIPKTFR